MPIVLAIHGGCGYSLTRDNLDSKREYETRLVLQQSLMAGYKVLSDGGSAVDAVVGSTLILEDCPLFNAGCGSVKTKEGLIEMDAGIMDGYTGNVGGCSIVTNVKNPILLAKGVMEKSEHSLLAGVGAEAFAKHLKLQIMPEEYFETKLRTEQLQKYLQEMGGKLGTADSYLPVVPEAENGVTMEKALAQVMTEDLSDTHVGFIAVDKEGQVFLPFNTGMMFRGIIGQDHDPKVAIFKDEHVIL